MLGLVVGSSGFNPVNSIAGFGYSNSITTSYTTILDITGSGTLVGLYMATIYNGYVKVTIDGVVIVNGVGIYGNSEKNSSMSLPWMCRFESSLKVEVYSSIVGLGAAMANYLLD